jgi:hypothetical protein
MHIIGKTIEENQIFICTKINLALIGKQLNLLLITMKDVPMDLTVINVMAGKNKNTILKIISQKLAQIPKDVIKEKIVLIFTIYLKKGKKKSNLKKKKYQTKKKFKIILNKVILLFEIYLYFLITYKYFLK